MAPAVTVQVSTLSLDFDTGDGVRGEPEVQGGEVHHRKGAGDEDQGGFITARHLRTAASHTGCLHMALLFRT